MCVSYILRPIKPTLAIVNENRLKSVHILKHYYTFFNSIHKYSATSQRMHLSIKSAAASNAAAHLRLLLT